MLDVSALTIRLPIFKAPFMLHRPTLRAFVRCKFIPHHVKKPGWLVRSRFRDLEQSSCFCVEPRNCSFPNGFKAKMRPHKDCIAFSRRLLRFYAERGILSLIPTIFTQLSRGRCSRQPVWRYACPPLGMICIYHLDEFRIWFPVIGGPIGGPHLTHIFSAACAFSPRFMSSPQTAHVVLTAPPTVWNRSTAKSSTSPFFSAQQSCGRSFRGAWPGLLIGAFQLQKLHHSPEQATLTPVSPEEWPHQTVIVLGM